MIAYRSHDSLPFLGLPGSHQGLPGSVGVSRGRPQPLPHRAPIEAKVTPQLALERLLLE